MKTMLSMFLASVFVVNVAYSNSLDLGGGGAGGGSSGVNGQIIAGLLTADNDCWVRLDGRLKSSLPAGQQTAATLLGIGANLPNMADRSLVGSSGTKALASLGGAATVTIAQNQLPNVAPSASFSNFPAVIGGGNASLDNSTSGVSGMVAWENGTGISTGWPMGAAQSVTVTSINGGVTQQTTSVQDPYLAANWFICLK
jgi:hypothetical protein